MGRSRVKLGYRRLRPGENRTGHLGVEAEGHGIHQAHEECKYKLVVPAALCELIISVGNLLPEVLRYPKFGMHLQ